MFGLKLKLTRRRILWSGLILLFAIGTGWWYESVYNSFKWKFRRSKPALEAYASQVMTTNPATPLTPPQRLGAFDTGTAERLPNGFLVFCDYGHWLDANGLAYSTVPLPRQMNGHDYFDHIEGNWYTILRN